LPAKAVYSDQVNLTPLIPQQVRIRRRIAPRIGLSIVTSHRLLPLFFGRQPLTPYVTISARLGLNRSWFTLTSSWISPLEYWSWYSPTALRQI